jgi:hypothetical protein
MVGDRVVAERSRSLPGVDGYVLAAEIGAIALAGELVGSHLGGAPVVVEVDNPQVPRVLLEGIEPTQADRIPGELARSATAFVRSGGISLRVMPRNSTPGLRRADRMARRRLWRRQTH